MAAEEDQQKIRDGRNTVIFFDGDSVQGKMTVASGAGGASTDLPIAIQHLSDQLDQKSGVNDLKKGTPPKSGEEPATSVNFRSQGGQARPAYRQDIMQEFLKASCLKLNAYNKQFMTIKEAVRIIGSMDVQWTDNPTKEEIQADVDAEMDIYSMLPDNPEEDNNLAKQRFEDGWQSSPI